LAVIYLALADCFVYSIHSESGRTQSSAKTGTELSRINRMEEKAMTKTRIVTIILLTAFVVAFQAPAMFTTTRAAELPATEAAVSSITLTITNPLPKATTVTLTGKKSYTINVQQGATITRTIDPGKYKFSYQGCLNKA